MVICNGSRCVGRAGRWSGGARLGGKRRQGGLASVTRLSRSADTTGRRVTARVIPTGLDRFSGRARNPPGYYLKQRSRADRWLAFARRGRSPRAFRRIKRQPDQAQDGSDASRVGLLPHKALASLARISHHHPAAVADPFGLASRLCAAQSCSAQSPVRPSLAVRPAKPAPQRPRDGQW